MKITLPIKIASDCEKATKGSATYSNGLLKLFVDIVGELVGLVLG